MVNKLYIYLGLSNLLFLTITSLVGIDFLFSLILVLWFDLIVFSANNLRKRAVFFSFLISFFTVLLGRDVLEVFFGYEKEVFSIEIQHHTYLSILLSLVVLSIVYFCFEKVFQKLNNKRNFKNKGDNKYVRRNLKYISLILYYISLVTSICYSIIKGFYVIRTGYAESYLADFTVLLGNSVPIFILDKLDQMLLIFLSFYLASLPTKRECKVPLYGYLIYLVFSLLSGQRSMIVLGLLWVFIYITGRGWGITRKNKLKKKYIRWAFVLIPVALVLLSAISTFREGENASLNSFFKQIGDFFYGQGVSINVIKRAYQYEYLLPSNKYYSIEFISTGLIGKILGFPALTGNNIAHATEGYSLAHALSYITMRAAYLLGRGTGTSYIAELYHDFGYFGIILGNAIYGIILCWLGQRSTSDFTRAIKLVMIQQILWAPRGGFSDLIIILFRPATLIAICLIYGLLFLKRYLKPD